jgi:hypothetical protein
MEPYSSDVQSEHEAISVHTSRGNRWRIIAAACGVTLVVLLGLGLALVAAPAEAATNYVPTNTSGGNWSTPTVWSPNGVPGSAPGDTVSMDLTSGGAYTILLDITPANPLASLSIGSTCSACTPILAIPAAKALTVNGPITIGSGTSSATLQLSGGTFSGSGNMAVNANGSIVWSAGTLSGSGTTTINAGATVSMTNTGFTNLDGRVVNNAGTWSYSPGANTLVLFNGAQINNSGSFNIFSNGPIASGAGGGTFTNSGTLQTFAGALNVTIGSGVAFNNSMTGTVSSGGGTLALAGGGTSSGSWSLQSTTTVDIPSSNYTMNGGTFGLNGKFRTSGGTMAITANSAIPNVAISGGGVSIAPVTTLSSTSLFWNDGVLLGPGTASVSSAITMTNTAGTLLDGATLNNNGTFNYTPGSSISSLFLKNGGKLNNNSVMNILADGQIGSNTGGGTFTNGANLTRNGGTGAFDIATSVIFNNTGGTVNLQTGSLTLSGGGTSTGPFNISTGSTIKNLAGTYILASGSSISGTGTLEIDGGTMTFNIPTSVANLILTNTGTLNGPGTVTIATSGLWGGGTMSGPGNTTVSAPATLTIDASGGNSAFLVNRTLTNAGLINYNEPGGSFFLNVQSGAVISNSNIFDIHADAAIAASGGASIDNLGAGIFKKTAGGGTSFIVPVFNNNGAVNISSGTVSFDGGGGTDVGTFTAASGATLQFGGGTRSIGGTGSIGGLGTVAINGSGTLNFSATGCIANPNPCYDVGGSTALGNSGIFNVNAPGRTAAFVLKQTATLGGSSTFTINGSSTWDGGTMNGSGSTVLSAGTMTIGGVGGTSLSLLDQRTLTNNAAIVYIGSGVQLKLTNGAILANNNSFDIHSNNDIFVTGTGTINNQAGGVFKKTSGGSTTNVAPTFNNAGSVQGISSTIAFNGAGTDTGTYDVSSGAVLEFGASTRSMNSGAQVTGAGTFRVIGSTGTVNFNSSTCMLSPSPCYAVTGTTALVLGTLNFNAPGTTAMLTMTNSTTLGGSANFTITNGGSWEGGTMSGSGTTFLNGGTLSAGVLPAGIITLDARHFVNNANFYYDFPGGPLYLQLLNGAIFDNNGIFDFRADAQIAGAAPATFNNNAGGTVMKTMATGTTPVAPIFNNAGTVQVLSGTISLEGGGLHTGKFDVVSPGILAFDGAGTNNVTTTGQIAGSGGVFLAGLVTLNFSATACPSTPPCYSVATTSLSNGSAAIFNASANTTGIGISGTSVVGGSGALTIGAGVSSWSGGTMNGSGSTTLLPGGTMTISSGTNHETLDTRTFNNNGTILYVTPAATFYLTLTNGTVFNNAGLFKLTSNGIVNQGTSSTFTNTGTLEKFSGGGTSTFYPPVTSSGSIIALNGLMAFNAAVIQTAGSTTLAGGNLSAPSLTLNGGSMSGTGTFTGDLFNNAAVSVATPAASGILNIAGNYTEGGGSTLGLKLGGTTAGSQYDRLAVTGALNLNNNGTLNVTLFNGFTPASGNTFDVITFGTRSGDFNAKNLPPLMMGGTFAANYTPTSLQLVANFIQADLATSQSAPATAFTSLPWNYVVTVTNNGGSNATGVTLTDNLPAGVTLNSVTTTAGTCMGNPVITCAIGNLANGATATVTISVSSTGTGARTNTAQVTANEFDPNTGNNVSSATTTVSAAPPCPNPVGGTMPVNGSTNVPTDGTLSWTADPAATSYNVYLGQQSANGCMTLAGVTTSPSFAYSSLTPGTVYAWRVESVRSMCPVTTTSCFSFVTDQNCPSAPATLIAPANNATVSSPVTFSWAAVSGATSYELVVTVGGTPPIIVAGTATEATLDLSGAPITWYVRTLFDNCPSINSPTRTFAVCSAPAAPVASVVQSNQSGSPYDLQWTALAGVVTYEVQESASETFSNPTTSIVPGTAATFIHEVTQATPYFYRVRGIAVCNQLPGPYSKTVRAVIAPPPAAGPSLVHDIAVPAGSTTVVIEKIFVPGYPPNSYAFTAHMDKPWLSVTPTAGLLPPEGLTFTVTADPADLPNGTQTGTLILLFTVSGAGKTGVDATTPPPAINVPVSISLVTPVSPTPKGASVDSALIIPSVGHVSGVNSQWQSDIRLANVSNTSQKYTLSFTPSGVDGTVTGQQTVITAEAGSTVALDDIVKRWYGLGTLGDGANGILEIRPVTIGKGEANDVSIPVTTVASSRTYNVTPNGTLGQFIPAIPLSGFIAKAGAGSTAQLLSLQQVAQSSAYRTNFGLVEGSGQPASVLVSIFSAAGTKLKDVSFDLKAGEHRQMDSFLATNGITSLADGRIQVQVVSTTGKVTAYASVVDNKTNDPLLVSGTKIGTLADRFTVPGVADLNTGIASWRSDLRLFNPSAVQVPATLTFYPAENPTQSKSTTLMLGAGEVRVLDNVLQSLFSITNLGGSVQVSTATPAPLVVTGRTFNQTAEGTFGQFIPAVTAAEAVGAADRALNILQVESSDRFRTNLGLAEVTGKAVSVEISVIVPDSKVTPKIAFNMAANEFRQLPILTTLGLGNTYNARLVIKVTGGDGRVTAYGSVIDMQTQDPTYVPAQ